MDYITPFLQKHYSDANLAKLLTAAESSAVNPMDGASCLLGRCDGGYGAATYLNIDFKDYEASREAERQFMFFMHVQIAGLTVPSAPAVSRANKKLIPLVQAEIARRGAAAKESAELNSLYHEVEESIKAVKESEDSREQTVAA